MKYVYTRSMHTILALVIVCIMGCAHNAPPMLGDTDAYLNRGNAYHVKGQYDQAIAEYTKVIEIKPMEAMAYYNRGISYDEKGK